MAALQQILVVLLGLAGLAAAAQEGKIPRLFLLLAEQPILVVAAVVEVTTGHPPLLVALAAPA